MKKYFLSIVALAGMLFATSCQESLVEPQMEGPTTFTVQLPDQMGTKADIGSANTVNQLFVSVYAENFVGDPLASAVVEKEQGDGTFTVSFNLIQDQKYSLIFWAQTTNAYVDKSQSEDATYDLKTIKIEDRFYSNENGAAFYACQTVTIDGKSKDVTLKRPFAQLNIGTTVESLTTDAGKVVIEGAKIKVTSVASSFNTCDGNGTGQVVYGQAETDGYAKVEGDDFAAEVGEYAKLTVGTDGYVYVSMDYLPVFCTPEQPRGTVDIELVIKTNNPTPIVHNFYSVPVQRNYRTNIVGNLISSTTDFNVVVDDRFVEDDRYGVLDGQVYERVSNSNEFNAAFEDENIDLIILDEDVVLTSNLTRGATEDYTLKISKGKDLTIDLNGKTLSATSSQTGKNYDMFDVRGTLTVKNGTMEYEHKGENMGWGASTNLFNVTAGGVLNLKGVTAKNLGGSDMGFVVHLNNWGEVTLNAENCTLESNYVPVRVFNSGYDMNNVTIKNSTLTGGSASFWVHNYTEEDFGSKDKADSQKELLNLNIYNQGNTFSPDLDGIRYGFTNSIRTDAYGITKVVSEDGTEVTLGSLIENGLVRRGVAGTVENTTIKKVVVEEGITTLYDRTFRRFYALEEVVLPEGLTTIGEAGSGVFQSCTALKNIVIPESVNVLGKGTFQECSSLESINIPSGVTRIEENCLRATGLVSVEFHAGVTYFGAQAFRDCKQLKEVIITAPEFTIEANAFGSMAAPYPEVTIYVANTAMKNYLESTLTYISQFKIVAPTEVNSTETINEALAKGEDVVLTGDIAVQSNETGSNGYGATGISQLNGGVIDGNGNDISVNAWGTWDTAINTTGGTIKNLNVTGGMRGIFVNHNSTNFGKVVLENVTIDGTVYTISCDQGTNSGLEAYNSTFKGWTSYAATIGDVKFEDCSFGKGQGYAYCRPYAPTEFVNCAFEAGYELEAVAEVTFENCTIGGVALTAENLATLVTSGLANATVKK